MFDSWESTVAVLVAVFIAYAVVLWIGTIIWTYRDVQDRTHDGWTQSVSMAMVVLFNIPGLVLYLILRPHETLNEAYERRLEAEALLRDMPEPRPTCPGCQREVKDYFIVCPQCRTKLRQPCGSCDRPLDLTWSACPYCATLTNNPPPVPSALAAKPFSTATDGAEAASSSSGGLQSKAPSPTPAKE